MSKNINRMFKNKKFKFWAAPITDQSFGAITFQDVLDFLKETSLADFYNDKKLVKPGSLISPVPETEQFKKEQKKFEINLKRWKEYNKRKKKTLASEVMPLIDKGVQPIGPTGPIDNFRTKDHKWEHHTEEYKRLKNLLFGRPADQPEVTDKPIVTTVVKKELLSE